jgi:hypothetical protein
VDLFQVATPRPAGIVLKSGLTERDALDAFRRHDTTWMRRRWRRRLCSIARVLVPYHVFHVTLTDGTRRQGGHFGVDAVCGSLDPHRFEDVLDTTTVDAADQRNCVPPSLTADEAWVLLEDKLRRVIFQTGFFRLRDPKFVPEGLPWTLHLPYWVGFYAHGRFVRVEVFDALRRSFEGAKARALVEKWLAEEKNDRDISPRPAPAPSLPSTLPYPHECRADR